MSSNSHIDLACNTNAPSNSNDSSSANGKTHGAPMNQNTKLMQMDTQAIKPNTVIMTLGLHEQLGLRRR
jgi:hypothetical protein